MRWYGILIACALLIGLWIGIKRSQKYGLDPDVILDFFLFMTPAVVIGARLYYVAFNFADYAAHPAEIIATWNGGLAIHGGIIAGVIVAVILCKVKKIRFFVLADTVIPGLAFGSGHREMGKFL